MTGGSDNLDSDDDVERMETKIASIEATLARTRAELARSEQLGRAIRKLYQKVLALSVGTRKKD